MKRKDTLGNDAVPAAPAAAPIILTQPQNSSIANKAFGALLLVGAVWAGKKWVWDPYWAKQEAKKLGDSPAAQAASIIWDAKGFWSDDEQKAVDAAKQIAQKGVSWEEVTKSFANLHEGRNISEYLDSFMSAGQKTKFFNTLNLTQSNKVDPITGKPAPIKSVDTWTAGMAVITKANVNVRKTPKWVPPASSLFWSPAQLLSYKTNVISIEPINTVLGVATGRTQFDEKAEPEGVLFVEVKVSTYDDKKVKTGTTSVWVAASQVRPSWFKDITDSTGKFLSPYVGYKLPKALYDKAESVSGLGAAVKFEINGHVFSNKSGRRVIVRKTPAVIDNVIKVAPADQFLGIFTGRVQLDENAGKGEGLTFLELKVPTIGKDNKLIGDHRRWFTGWVAIGAVEPGPEKRARLMSANRWLTVSIQEYNSALASSSGYDTPTDYSREVVLTKPAEILSPKLTPVKPAPAGITVGFFISELVAGTERYIKFETIQQQIRWVNASAVKLVSK